MRCKSVISPHISEETYNNALQRAAERHVSHHSVDLRDDWTMARSGSIQMTDSTLVLELLEDIGPRGYCDDCLSLELDIRPRQTVNQICRTLYAAKRIERAKTSCSRCGKTKITNVRGGQHVPSTPPRQAPLPTLAKPSEPTAPLDIERARTEIVQICRQLWQRTQPSPPSHSISANINSLKNSGALPTHQANMMLTLCGLRNVYVYEDLTLGAREMIIAVNAREIVLEWWARNDRGVGEK
jgi:hypothetical protein